MAKRYVPKLARSVECPRCSDRWHGFLENDRVNLIGLPEITGVIVRCGDSTMRGQLMVWWEDGSSEWVHPHDLHMVR